MPPSEPSQLNSPLETTATDSISELFSRDPLSWSDSDIDKIIAHQRELRAKIGEGPKAKAPKAPPVDGSKDVSDLLSDLGL